MLFFIFRIIYNLLFVRAIIIPPFSYNLLLRQVLVVWIPKYLKLLCPLKMFNLERSLKPTALHFPFGNLK